MVIDSLYIPSFNTSVTYEAEAWRHTRNKVVTKAYSPVGCLVTFLVAG
jgi:hypothetical protein